MYYGMRFRATLNPMTIEERMDRLEARLGSQDEMVRELRDAVTVTAQLEARQSHALRDHTEWLQEHDRAMKAHDAAMKDLDERIRQLVSGFGEFIRRSEKKN